MRPASGDWPLNITITTPTSSAAPGHYGFMAAFSFTAMGVGVFAMKETQLDLADGPQYSFEPTETLLREFDTNVRVAREALVSASDADFEVSWSLMHGEHVQWADTRRVVVRNHLNHLIHHRGQLTVYLRLVDVPIPPIYGPTADERA